MINVEGRPSVRKETFAVRTPLFPDFCRDKSQFHLCSGIHAGMLSLMALHQVTNWEQHGQWLSSRTTNLSRLKVQNQRPSAEKGLTSPRSKTIIVPSMLARRPDCPRNTFWFSCCVWAFQKPCPAKINAERFVGLPVVKPWGLVPVLCTKTRRPSATSERVGQSFAVPELAAESAKVPLCSSLCLPPCGRLQSILLGGAVQDGFER